VFCYLSDYFPALVFIPHAQIICYIAAPKVLNDLCNITDLGKFVLFADDTNIFVAFDTKDKVYNMANEVLEAVGTYK
jgi:hypothetical protein